MLEASRAAAERSRARSTLVALPPATTTDTLIKRLRDGYRRNAETRVGRNEIYIQTRLPRRRHCDADREEFAGACGRQGRLGLKAADENVDHVLAVRRLETVLAKDADELERG